MAATNIKVSGSTVAPEVARSKQSFKVLLVLSTMTSTVSFIDRSVLNILAEPIRQDINFSDTQLGLLTGFAFAAFYSLMGIPIARYVDRPTTNRSAVISICLAVWSSMTVASGFVTSYIQLLITRMFVAIGESGAGPAIMTLLDNYVEPAKRSRVFAIYGLGVPIGTLLGLMLGGWLVDLFNWRVAFFVVGAPGLILAILVWLFIREPRKDMPLSETAIVKMPSVRENIDVMIKSSAVMWLLAATSLGGMFVVGLPSWAAVYLIRVLELSATQAGLILGLIMGIGGGLGTYLGGVFADKWSTGDQGRALLVPAYGLLIGIPAAIFAFLTDSWVVFSAFYAITVFGGAAWFGPVMAVIQRLVPLSYRATTMVILIMLANLIGAGLGPTLIGIGSDLLTPAYGVDGLRWVMLSFNLVAIIPAIFYIKAGKLAEQAIVKVEAKA